MFYLAIVNKYYVTVTLGWHDSSSVWSQIPKALFKTYVHSCTDLASSNPNWRIENRKKQKWAETDLMEITMRRCSAKSVSLEGEN